MGRHMAKTVIEGVVEAHGKQFDCVTQRNSHSKRVNRDIKQGGNQDQKVSVLWDTEKKKLLLIGERNGQIAGN